MCINGYIVRFLKSGDYQKEKQKHSQKIQKKEKWQPPQRVPLGLHGNETDVGRRLVVECGVIEGKGLRSR